MHIVKKLLSIFLAMLLLFSSAAVGGAGFALTAAAAGTGKAIELVTNGAAALQSGFNTANAATIWYGGSKWRVIGYDGAGAASESGTMTLFANAGMGASYFDFDGKTGKQYSGSDLEKQTNQIYNNAFSDPEQLAVRDRTLNAGTYDGANTDGVQGSSVGYARLWPLSTKEANAVSADLRVDTGAWWLRSPGDGVNNVAFVKKEGDVDHLGQSFLSSSGVRPAFMVDLDKVIFASAAVGGKQGDGALTPIDGYHGSEWKLTLWESRRQWFSVTETEAAGYAGETVTLHYKYAETGENEYISAIVTDADGNALYYGRIMQATTEDGTVDITIPVKLPGGSYTLKLFNEQYNGDKKTDFSSPLIDVALTVHPGNGKALQMTESGTAENILGTQQSNIWFGSYQQSSDGNGGYNVDPIKWRVLSNDGGKLLLLSDRSLDAKMYYPQPQNVTWAESTIRSWLNGYDGTANMAGEDHSGDSFKGSAFTETEFAAVAETDVVTENSPEYGTPGGSDTKDKVFLLSLAEAINTVYGFTNSYEPTDTRVSLNTDYAKECSTDYYGNSYSVGRWWLRSPGRDGTDAVYIENDGSVYEYGLRVFHYVPCVVRPALNVDLNSILFTSAAEGGKEGDGLTAVSYYDGADWKLTVLDADRSSFTASCASASGDVRTVKYSGAKTGDNEYISAVIVDGDGAVTYYGRLCKAESGDNNTVTVDVSGKMNDGDKLYVFNEQYNGDKKTDYASALKEIVSPVVSASTLQQGDTFEMGMYPQTRVTDDATIAALNAIDCTMTNYGYMQKSNAESQTFEPVDMSYADILYNGEAYRKVTINQYRPNYTMVSSSNNHQETNGYTTGTYYFKWEPIEWQVLAGESDGVYVMSKALLDSQAYNNYNLATTTWEDCSLRTWLNDGFYATAFSEAEQAKINATDLVNEDSPVSSGLSGGNDTTDHLWVLSYNDAINSAYGFNTDAATYDGARKAQGTDYAKSQGIYTSSGFSDWRLRTPGGETTLTCKTLNSGSVSYESRITNTDIGVRPAFKLNLDATVGTSDPKTLIQDPNLSLSVPAVTYGEDLVITATLTDGVTGDVAFTVNGTGYSAPIQNGTAILTLTNPPAGDYAVQAEFPGNGTYGSASAQTSVTVSKKTPVISVSATDAFIGSKTKITVTYPAEISQNETSESGTGFVTIYMNGMDMGVFIGENGVIEQSYNMADGFSAGTQTVKAKFNGSDNYAASYAETTFEVTQTAPASTLTTGDTFEMGMYPQTKVTDNDTIYALEQIWCPMTNYGYIKNSTETVDMTYADIAYNGEVYRRVTIKEYRPFATDQSSFNNNQETNGYSTRNGLGDTYYFKWEPITWQVLAKESDGVYVMSKSLLDSQAYNNNNEATTWETGSLRSWLNDGFYNVAFSAAEQAKMVSITHDNEDSPYNDSVSGGNDTTDRLWVLSHSDAINSDYGFSPDEQTRDEARKAQGTDYAKSQGLLINRSTGNSNWWLRSPGINEHCAFGVFSHGAADMNTAVYDTGNGIRPAFKLDLNATVGTSDPKTLIQDPNLTMENQETVYGETITLTATLAQNAAGTVDFTVTKDAFTATYSANIENGAATVSLPVLDAGTYSVTAEYAGHGNFDAGTASATLTVNQKAVSVRVTGPDGPYKQYNGQEQSHTDTVVWIYDRDESGLDEAKLRYTGNTTVKGTNAGRYETALSADDCVCDDSNFDVTFTAQGAICMTINQTALDITADSKETNHGEDLAALTYTIKSNHNYYYNEAELVISISTDADKNKPGSYEITVTVQDNPNYAIRVFGGTYTVGNSPHTWGGVTYTWTGTASVKAERKCVYCEEVETETKATTSQQTKAPTCTVNGETTYTAVFENTAFETQQKTVADIDALNHDWKTEWSKDGVNHWHDCTRCDEKNDEAAHTYGDVSYTWTQTRGAWKVTAKHACTVCEWEETETVNATGAQSKAPTCTVNGETTYTAQFENAAFETQQKTVADIDPTGHTYGKNEYTWEADKSTCTAVCRCTNAGCTHAITETAKSTRTMTIKPTCEGKGEYTYTAAFNNKRFTAQTATEEIAALGHAYDAVVTEPTCTAGGYTTYTCSRCGDSYTDSETAALGHTAGDAVHEKGAPATCEKDGSYEEAIYCAVCGEELSRKTVTLPATGHEDADNDGKCDRCSKQMQGGDHCKLCGKIHERTFCGIVTKWFHTIAYYAKTYIDPVLGILWASVLTMLFP